jgi:hypothetical protein
VSLLRHKKPLRPSRQLEPSDRCVIASARALKPAHDLEVFGLFLQFLMMQFNVAFFGQNRCPLLEGANAGFDGIAWPFASCACQEPFAGAFQVIALSHDFASPTFSSDILE